MIRPTLTAALFAVTLGAATAAFAQQGSIQVEHAWSRAAMAGRTGVVYLTIKDSGAPDRLTAVASPVAQKAELHESFEDHGVMKMRAVAGLAVSPDKPAVLQPGGYHIMLVNLKQPLKAGETVPLTLTFEKAGTVAVSAMVEKAGAAAMPMQGHGGMQMQDHGGMQMQGHKP